VGLDRSRLATLQRTKSAGGIPGRCHLAVRGGRGLAELGDSGSFGMGSSRLEPLDQVGGIGRGHHAAERLFGISAARAHRRAAPWAGAFLSPMVNC